MLAMQRWNRNRVYSRVTPMLATLHWCKHHIVNQAIAFCMKVCYEIDHVLYRSWKRLNSPFSTPADPTLQSESYYWNDFFRHDNRRRSVAFPEILLSVKCFWRHTKQIEAEVSLKVAPLIPGGWRILSSWPIWKLRSLGYHGWDGHTGATSTKSTAWSFTFLKPHPMRFHWGSLRVSTPSGPKERHPWLSPDIFSPGEKALELEGKGGMQTYWYCNLETCQYSLKDWRIWYPVWLIPHRPRFSQKILWPDLSRHLIQRSHARMVAWTKTVLPWLFMYATAAWLSINSRACLFTSSFRYIFTARIAATRVERYA